MRRNIAMRGSTSPARSKWPRIVAFLLLMLLLVGAGYHARWIDRFPLWIEIAAFLAISSAIAILIEWGGASHEGR